MKEERKIVLFALSTCPACKKTKELLKKYNVEYLLVELDTIDRDSRERLLTELRRFNPAETFPTIVVNAGEKVIVGFREDEILSGLGLK